MIRTYFSMLIEEQFPDAFGKMKQFASWFTHGVPGGAALRKTIYEAREAPEILKRVEEFFEARLGAAVATTHTVTTCVVSRRGVSSRVAFSDQFLSSSYHRAWLDWIAVPLDCIKIHLDYGPTGRATNFPRGIFLDVSPRNIGTVREDGQPLFRKSLRIVAFAAVDGVDGR